MNIETLINDAQIIGNIGKLVTYEITYSKVTVCDDIYNHMHEENDEHESTHNIKGLGVFEWIHSLKSSQGLYPEDTLYFKFNNLNAGIKVPAEGLQSITVTPV